MKYFDIGAERASSRTVSRREPFLLAGAPFEAAFFAAVAAGVFLAVVFFAVVAGAAFLAVVFFTVVAGAAFLAAAFLAAGVLAAAFFAGAVRAGELPDSVTGSSVSIAGTLFGPTKWAARSLPPTEAFLRRRQFGPNSDSASPEAEGPMKAARRRNGHL